MIPHQPPMLFPVDGDAVTLPAEHPLCHGGDYPTLALVELAAQLAGRHVDAPPGHAGMLVELENVEVLAPSVPAGTTLRWSVALQRTMGPLWRFRVRLARADAPEERSGVLDAGLTLRVG